MRAQSFTTDIETRYRILAYNGRQDALDAHYLARGVRGFRTFPASGWGVISVREVDGPRVPWRERLTIAWLVLRGRL